jgi:hypothetical protein
LKAYFRLNVLSLKIPLLRERREDIPLLVGHFLERLARVSGHERTLNDAAMKALLAYDWPGNVRELENCLERACAFSSGPVIQLGDLPSSIHGVPGPIAAEGNTSAKILLMAELEKQTILGRIAQLNGDKLLCRQDARDREDDALPEAEGVRGSGLNFAVHMPFSFERVGVPSRIGPLSFAAHKDFSDPAGIDRPLSAGLGLHQILTPDYRDVTKALNFTPGELQATQFSSRCLKLGGGSKYVRLFLPFFLTRADHNRVRGNEFLQGVGIVVEPCPPDCFTHLEELFSIIRRGCPA